MITCIALIIGVISCTNVDKTKLVPSEAATILSPRQFVYVTPITTPQQQVIILKTKTREGPFGEFPPIHRFYYPYYYPQYQYLDWYYSSNEMKRYGHKY